MLESVIESGRTHISELEILLRLTLAAVFGAAIGLDREVRDRPAGLRTHMMIALAAAVFTVLALELFDTVKDQAARDQVQRVTADPIRIIEAVTAGVAFLAAGAIIQARGRVHGLTTGASMWLAGSVGLACGAGYYSIALFALVLALIILIVLKKIESWAGISAAHDRESDDAA